MSTALPTASSAYGPDRPSAVATVDNATPQGSTYRRGNPVQRNGAGSLVAGCDKLHNLQTTMRDLRAGQPTDYWSRFTAGAESQAWYYGECGKALAGSPVAADFDRAYAEFLGILRERGEL